MDGVVLVTGVMAAGTSVVAAPDGELRPRTGTILADAQRARVA
ncbi:hypothetical protein ACIP4Y_00360 [Streptomyces sp. NPDC088810]